MRWIALALLVACHGAATTSPTTSHASIDAAGMDRTIVPGDDFFTYANGGWLRTHEIPPDKPNYGTGTITFELTQARTQELIKTADMAPAGSEARKIGDFYASFMDEPSIEAKGLAVLRPALDAIAKVGDEKSLAQALGTTLRADVDVLNATNYRTPNLFGLWIAQDLDDPTAYARSCSRVA